MSGNLGNPAVVSDLVQGIKESKEEKAKSHDEPEENVNGKGNNGQIRPRPGSQPNSSGLCFNKRWYRPMTKGDENVRKAQKRENIDPIPKPTLDKQNNGREKGKTIDNVEEIQAPRPKTTRDTGTNPGKPETEGRPNHFNMDQFSGGLTRTRNMLFGNLFTPPPTVYSNGCPCNDEPRQFWNDQNQNQNCNCGCETCCGEVNELKRRSHRTEKRSKSVHRNRKEKPRKRLRDNYEMDSMHFEMISSESGSSKVMRSKESADSNDKRGAKRRRNGEVVTVGCLELSNNLPFVKKDENNNIIPGLLEDLTMGRMLKVPEQAVVVQKAKKKRDDTTSDDDEDGSGSGSSAGSGSSSAASGDGDEGSTPSETPPTPKPIVYSSSNIESDSHSHHSGSFDMDSAGFDSSFGAEVEHANNASSYSDYNYSQQQNCCYDYTKCQYRPIGRGYGRGKKRSCKPKPRMIPKPAYKIPIRNREHCFRTDECCETEKLECCPPPPCPPPPNCCPPPPNCCPPPPCPPPNCCPPPPCPPPPNCCPPPPCPPPPCPPPPNCCPPPPCPPPLNCCPPPCPPPPCPQPTIIYCMPPCPTPPPKRKKKKMLLCCAPPPCPPPQKIPQKICCPPPPCCRKPPRCPPPLRKLPVPISPECSPPPSCSSSSCDCCDCNQQDNGPIIIVIDSGCDGRCRPPPPPPPCQCKCHQKCEDSDDEGCCQSRRKKRCCTDCCPGKRSPCQCQPPPMCCPSPPVCMPPPCMMPPPIMMPGMGMPYMMPYMCGTGQCCEDECSEEDECCNDRNNNRQVALRGQACGSDNVFGTVNIKSVGGGGQYDECGEDYNANIANVAQYRPRDMVIGKPLAVPNPGYRLPTPQGMIQVPRVPPPPFPPPRAQSPIQRPLSPFGRGRPLPDYCYEPGRGRGLGQFRPPLPPRPYQPPPSSFPRQGLGRGLQSIPEHCLEPSRIPRPQQQQGFAGRGAGRPQSDCCYEPGMGRGRAMSRSIRTAGGNVNVSNSC